MLGLCWTPATVSGMQKVASTMPSNPEQLLGAILVRKDIFQRFESTMHDTCLDANNLLEYLFSLYNSTATPSERENFPSPQSFNLVRRGPKPGKKAMSRMQQVFDQQSGNIINSHHSPHGTQLGMQGRQNEQQQRGGQIGGMLHDGHTKKIKLDALNYPMSGGGAGGSVLGGGGVFAGQMQTHSEFQGFSGGGGSVGTATNNNVKMEHLQAEMEAQSQQLHGQAASPLPPFSQIRRQSNQPYSPATAQYPDRNIGMAPFKNHMGTDVNLVDPGSTPGLGIKIANFVGSAAMDTPDGQDMEDIQVSSEILPEALIVVVVVGVVVVAVVVVVAIAVVVILVVAVVKVEIITNTPDHTPEGLAEPESEPRRGRRGRKKRNHQCFCGALFTRADNLKRHIRKCHEEKLEKLSSAPLDIELEGSGEGAGSGAELMQGFVAGSQGELGSPMQPPNLTSDQHQQEQHPQQQDNIHQHHHQQQQQHHQHQHHQQFENEAMKPMSSQPSTSSNNNNNNNVRWSCFCGESFDDHRQLVEHTRTHENNS
ncbi:hypothetical protein ElyMa_000785600 [Elysia marginata]|uniref:C2H2-type domain-containing protein n=1 Tax=Elysia marginata TaxID=1093978 RepID=A0AAV4GUW5_9GAST|nr:hypothetical protein ElyMa_000785600 [Elysia marginata]